jgi:hypothetical protein
MGEEFEKISPAGVESTNGFTVRMMNARGGIITATAWVNFVWIRRGSWTGAMFSIDLARSQKEAALNLFCPT